MNSHNNLLNSNTLVASLSFTSTPSLASVAQSETHPQQQQQQLSTATASKCRKNFEVILGSRNLFKYMCSYLQGQESQLVWTTGVFSKAARYRSVCKAFADALPPAHLLSSTPTASHQPGSASREEKLGCMLKSVLDKAKLSPEQASEWSVLERLIKHASSFSIDSSNLHFIHNILRVINSLRPYKEGDSNNLQIHVKHLFLQRAADVKVYKAVVKLLKTVDARVWSMEIDNKLELSLLTDIAATIRQLGADRFLGLPMLYILEKEVRSRLIVVPAVMRGALIVSSDGTLPDTFIKITSAMKLVEFDSVEIVMHVEKCGDFEKQLIITEQLYNSLIEFSAIVSYMNIPIKVTFTKNFVREAHLTQKTLERFCGLANVRVSLSSSSSSAAGAAQQRGVFQLTFSPLSRRSNFV